MPRCWAPLRAQTEPLRSHTQATRCTGSSQTRRPAMQPVRGSTPSALPGMSCLRWGRRSGRSRVWLLVGIKVEAGKQLAERHLPPHSLPRLARVLHGTRVLNGRDVSRVLVQRHGFQDSAHDLSAPRLRQHAHEVEVPDHSHGPELTANSLEQLAPQLFRWLVAPLEHDEGRDHLHAHGVRTGSHAGFSNACVAKERRLDLDRADPVTSDLDDLVRSTAEPDVTVLVE